MTSLRALVAAIIAALVAAVGRVRARWYRFRQLPTVRKALEDRALAPPSPPIEALKEPQGRLAADEPSPDYLSVPSSLKVVRGEPADTFRVASTRILPAPPQDLAVYRPEPWNVEARRAMRPGGFPEPRPGEEALKQVRLSALPAKAPELVHTAVFGLDDALASTRFERAFRGPHLVDALLRPRRPVVPLPRPAPREALGIADARKFGLTDDAAPAALAVPVERRHPPKLPRARATFHARYADPHHSEAFYKDVPRTFGEDVQEGAEAFFDGPGLGATEREDLWELGDDLDEQMKEVREQFILRRDVDRVDYPDEDLTDLEGVSTGVDVPAIQVFTGLTFEDLEPEPFHVLKMRLEAPPLDMAPPTESAEAQLAWLLSAIKDHPPDGDAR